MSFEVTDWREVRDWADRVSALGVPMVWGVGRHGPGNDTFFMVRDPDGNLAEISAELEVWRTGAACGHLAAWAATHAQFIGAWRSCAVERGRAIMSSAERLIGALALFTPKQPAWTPEKAAQALGVSRASAYRYFLLLYEAGYIEANSGSGYTLGPRIVELDRQIRERSPGADRRRRNGQPGAEDGQSRSSSAASTVTACFACIRSGAAALRVSSATSGAAPCPVSRGNVESDSRLPSAARAQRTGRARSQRSGARRIAR